jgi:DNA polymerase III subunit delta'
MRPQATVATTTEFDPYRGVVGQVAARQFLAASAADPVHAYLLVGPEGAGTRDLALGFAADVLCRDHPDGDRDNIHHRVVTGNHPDVPIVGAEGTRLREKETAPLLAEGMSSATEGPHKVVIGVGFDAITEEARAQLLKLVEEPPPSTIFVFTAEFVNDELVTIASRCVRVDVPPLGPSEVLEALSSDPNLAFTEPNRLERASIASQGDLRMARILATDERFALRLDAWDAAPSRLDGTGAAVFEIVAGLMSTMADGLSSIEAALKEESEAADREAEELGRRRESRTDESARHKRILRKLRMADFRAGLGVVARRYRDAAVDGTLSPEVAAAAVARLDTLARDLVVRNPNEALQLQALFLQLPALPPAR